MKKELTFIVISLVAIFSFKGEELRNGDLIFVGEGCGDFSKAISMSTSSSESIKLVHVGIIEVCGKDDIKVIEASPENGVREIAFEKFIESVPKIDGYPQIIFMRLIRDFPVEKCILNAKSYLGKPYDWWYLLENDKIYCSELVYESYLDETGTHIFELTPMNFRSPDGSMPKFWIELFDKLGEPVPEGIPGTNPSDLSKSSVLRKIEYEL